MSLREVLKERKARKTRPYKGALGSLPDWVPESMVREFLSAHGALERRYGAFRAKQQLQRYRVSLQGKLQPDDEPELPYEAVIQIEKIAFIQSVVSLGEMKGLEKWFGRYGKDIVRGRKVLEGARQSHVKVHGSSAEKEARWNAYRATMKEVSKDESTRKLSYYQRAQIVACKHGCSYKTVMRRTTDPLGE